MFKTSISTFNLPPSGGSIWVRRKGVNLSDYSTYMSEKMKIHKKQTFDGNLVSNNIHYSLFLRKSQHILETIE